MRFEDQGANGASQVMSLFLFRQEYGRFLGSTERRIMGMGPPTIQIVGRQEVGKYRAEVIISCWVGNHPCVRKRVWPSFLV